MNEELMQETKRDPNSYYHCPRCNRIVDLDHKGLTWSGEPTIWSERICERCGAELARWLLREGMGSFCIASPDEIRRCVAGLAKEICRRRAYQQPLQIIAAGPDSYMFAYDLARQIRGTRGEEEPIRVTLVVQEHNSRGLFVGTYIGYGDAVSFVSTQPAPAETLYYIVEVIGTERASSIEEELVKNPSIGKEKVRQLALIEVLGGSQRAPRAPLIVPSGDIVGYGIGDYQHRRRAMPYLAYENIEV